MGSYYVDNKYAYETVEARVATAANTIPSGASIVQGIYYMWDSDGFMGNGWMTHIKGGPTGMYPGFSSDDDVANYVSTVGNLDDVFKYWSQHYTLEGWDAFYNAVGPSSGCMDVVHGTE